MSIILLAIREELTRRRIFQSQMAKDLGVSQKHISQVLSGYSGASAEFLLTMLDYLDLQLTITRKAPPVDKPETPRPLRTLVFAGTARQAREWALENRLGPHQYLYIATAEDLRGRNTAHMPREFIGTFTSRDDADEMLRHLNILDRTTALLS